LPDEDGLLTPEQAAEYLGVTRRWLIKEGVYRRKIPHIRPPGSNIIRFKKSDLDDVINGWRIGYQVGAAKPNKKRRAKTKARR